MVILIRKRHLAYGLLLCCFVAGLSAVLWHGNAAFTAAFAPEALPAGGTGWRRAAPGVTASGGRRRAVLTRRRERSGAERVRGRDRRGAWT